MGRRAFAVVLSLVALGLPFVPGPVLAAAPAEYQLLGLVNSGRSSTPMHSGLQTVARGHSRDMASAGRLSHSGAPQRIRNAAPDPSESNGYPDDGYTGAFCENVAYYSGVSEAEVADRVYQGWRNSAGHARCMSNAKMTAAGVGLYFDGTTWWATLELMEDRTPPGSGRAVDPAPAIEPLPVTTPAHPTTRAAPRAVPLSEAPTATPDAVSIVALSDPAPASKPVGERRAVEALEPAPAADRGQLGWPETIAGIGIALVSAFAYRRTGTRRRRDA